MPDTQDARGWPIGKDQILDWLETRYPDAPCQYTPEHTCAYSDMYPRKDVAEALDMHENKMVKDFGRLLDKKDAEIAALKEIAREAIKVGFNAIHHRGRSGESLNELQDRLNALEEGDV